MEGRVNEGESKVPATAGRGRLPTKHWGSPQKSAVLQAHSVWNCADRLREENGKSRVNHGMIVVDPTASMR